VQADLYKDEGKRALATVDSHWEAMKKSMILTVQQVRVRAVHLRGCAALAAGEPARAERDAHRLEGEKAPWASALALTLRGGLAARRGQHAEAAARYAQATTALLACDMPLYAAAAQRRRGEFLTGDDGALEVGRADAWMESHQVKQPMLLSRMLAP
jgi:hypothetical protein